MYMCHTIISLFELKRVFIKKGLVLLSKSTEGINHDSADCLAVTLFPTKFPSVEYNYAVQMQTDYNELVLGISNDYEFLRDSLKE